jgi:hypothetical protein
MSCVAAQNANLIVGCTDETKTGLEIVLRRDDMRNLRWGDIRLREQYGDSLGQGRAAAGGLFANQVQGEYPEQRQPRERERTAKVIDFERERVGDQDFSYVLQTRRNPISVLFPSPNNSRVAVRLFSFVLSSLILSSSLNSE